MSASDPPPLRVDDTLGALLVGSFFAAAFWGVTSVQTYIYYQRYPNDHRFLRLVVAVLWVLDTFDACLTSHLVYHYLVTNYANPKAISLPVWSMIIHTAVTTVTDVIIRCMFSKRVWGLSNRNMALTSVVWVISLGDLVIGMVITAKAFRLASWTELNTLVPFFYASFFTAFAGDLYISVVLCYYLFKARTGVRRSDTLVNSLITYIITTGLLTSVDAALGLISYIIMPKNYVFMAFYFNLAKLYINSYLALLNARQRFRRASRPVSIHLSGLSSADPRFATGFTDSSTENPSSGILSKLTRHDLEIAVNTTANSIEDAHAQAL